MSESTPSGGDPSVPAVDETVPGGPGARDAVPPPDTPTSDGLAGGVAGGVADGAGEAAPPDATSVAAAATTADGHAARVRHWREQSRRRNAKAKRPWWVELPILIVIAFVLTFYLGLGLIALAFYASFFREAVEGLSLTGLDFHFYARTKDWIWLFLGDIALVLCTIGIGSIFLQYRHWKFFVTHMGVTGTIYTDELTQSQTKTSRHGEGLLDALDVGAF